MTKPLLIAEVKTESPFGFKSDKSWNYLFGVAGEYGDWVSIHTDPQWSGSLELVKKARAMTEKPILAKGIHSSDEEVKNAFKAGADYVLVVGRIPRFKRDQILYEPLSLDELKQNDTTNIKVVWNSRDLTNGKNKDINLDEVRKFHKGWLCQASNIKTKNDVSNVADAILVGENLERFISSKA